MLLIDRQVTGHSKRTTTRDDRYFVNRISLRHFSGDDDVTTFMIRSSLFFFVTNNSRGSLKSHQYFIFCILEIFHHHAIGVMTSGKKRRFIDKICKISTRKSRCAFCKHVEINIRRKWHFASMHFQNSFATTNIRAINHYLTIKSARTKQCRVKHIRAICCRHNDYAAILLKAIHFDKKLIKRLFALIVSAAQTGTAMTTDCVYLINKDDTWRAFLCVFEQITNARCTNADKHLYEVSTGDRHKWYACFAGNGASEKGFAGTRRTQQQDTARNFTAEALKFLRLF